MRHQMKRVIDGKRYDTKTASVIASNEYWDGNKYDRGGTNTHLYRTPNGRYFVVYSTCWQGARSRIEALTQQQAMEMYEQLPKAAVEYEEAFPGEVAEEA